MPHINPLPGVRYNQKKVRDIARVVAPPYDIISPGQQTALYRKDPHNIIRLILGTTRRTDTARDNQYVRAKKYFTSWRRQGIMTQDEAPAFYIYAQEYVANGKRITRVGFMGCMELDLGKRRTVLPHENTLRAPKVDRLNLMRQVRANLSPIFVLYDDHAGAASALMRRWCAIHRPLVAITLDGVRHRLWRMDDPAACKKLSRIMAAKKTFIADGHHRYEVARMYATEIQHKNFPAELKKNARSIMVYCVPTDESMLTVLPAHRVVKDAGRLTVDELLQRLAPFFAIKKVHSLPALMAHVHAHRRGSAFGIYAGKNRWYALRLTVPAAADCVMHDKSRAWRRLDVSILHHFIMRHLLAISDTDENVTFVKDPREAVQLVNDRSHTLAFIMNPTKVAQVLAIARSSERMPRKATYFYPKPLSGLVLRPFERGAV